MSELGVISSHTNTLFYTDSVLACHESRGTQKEKTKVLATYLIKVTAFFFRKAKGIQTDDR